MLSSSTPISPLPADNTNGMLKTACYEKIWNVDSQSETLKTLRIFSTHGSQEFQNATKESIMIEAALVNNLVAVLCINSYLLQTLRRPFA